MGSTSNSRKFIKNILLFALSNFIPKAMSFLLVPVYTSYLTTEDYGTSDLIITTVSLLLPIFTLNISSSVMRFTIEAKNDKRAYAIGIKIRRIGAVLLIAALAIACPLLKLSAVYAFLIFVLFMVSADYQIRISYMRAMERVTFLTVCGIVNSFVCLAANILFITVFRWGAYGFVLSSILGYVIANVMTVIPLRKDQIRIRSYSLRKERAYVKEMLAYCIPYIFSGIAWWITSVSDKYVLTLLAGVAATGVYSIAYKIPTILQLVQDVFNPAWTLQVYDIYKNEDGMQYIGKTYEFYNFLIVLACSGLIFLDKPLAGFLFSNEFYKAWKYVPVLLMSVVFLSMSACISVMMDVHKLSGLYAKGSIYGACINIVLNFVLIHFLGIQGAALATLFCYIFSWGYSWFQVNHICTIPVNFKKHICMYLLLAVETIIVLYVPQFWISGIVVVLLALMNMQNVAVLIGKSAALGRNFLEKAKSMLETEK